jgi:hypothetical protein
MKCIEGAWTDNDAYINGGSFASPMHNGDWAALDTSSAMTVHKATASSDNVIGQLVSEPQGEHTTNGRYATVLLAGAFVKEVEISPSMADTISVGDSVQFSVSGGYFGEGLWTRDATPNGTRALGPAGPTPATGTVIPVLFGFVGF